MKKTSETIVFFGSGPVAAECLGLLLRNFSVEAIITKPSTENQMTKIGGNIPVYTAKSKAELDELIHSSHLKSRLGVLIDFGVILSQEVIDSFQLGILNSHFSLLPQWRGADPITFAVLSGQDVTGVSLMFLTEGMDEGPVVSVGEQPISSNDTTETLTEKLILLSDTLLTAEIPHIFCGDHIGQPQELVAQLMGRPVEPTYSRKLTKADGEIDWNKPAASIEREVRAYQPWPRSYTKLNQNEVIIKQAEVVADNGTPGSYRYDKKSLVIYCGQDALSILTLQPAGKKEMPIQAFLAGYRL